MWIDADGVGHSVALSDPTSLMSFKFQTSFDATLSTHRAAVLLILEQAEAHIFEQDLRGLADVEMEPVFEGLTPPADLLDGHVRAPDDVRTAIEGTEWRWRLDVICALLDYTD